MATLLGNVRMQLPQPFSVLLRIRSVLFGSYQHAQKLTCDRIGVIATRDVKPALSTLVKQNLGTMRGAKVDLSSLTPQSQELRQGLGGTMLRASMVMNPQPLAVTRLFELVALAGEPPPAAPAPAAPAQPTPAASARAAAAIAAEAAASAAAAAAAATGGAAPSDSSPEAADAAPGEVGADTPAELSPAVEASTPAAPVNGPAADTSDPVPGAASPGREVGPTIRTNRCAARRRSRPVEREIMPIGSRSRRATRRLGHTISHL